MYICSFKINNIIPTNFNNRKGIAKIAQSLSEISDRLPKKDVNEDLAENLTNKAIEEWTNELIHSNCIENDSSSNGLKYHIKQAILDGITMSNKN